jgi:alkylhydroperoxidase/carboxymuconolactone decarboxylase family protein YurZ
MSVDAAVNKALEEIIPGEAPLIETLVRMNADTQQRSGLDDRTYLLVRVAALVAVDATPTSFLATLAVADDLGVTAEEVRGVLVAVAPVVGSARALAGAEKALQAVAAARQL